MEQSTCQNSQAIDFSISSADLEIVEAVQKLSEKIKNTTLGESCSEALTHECRVDIHALQIHELLLSFEDEEQQCRVLYLLAETLAFADQEIAWAGLCRVADELVLSQNPDITVEQQSAAIATLSSHFSEKNQWLVALPNDQEKTPVYLFNQQANCLYGSFQLVNDLTGFEQSKNKMLGFNHASIFKLSSELEHEALISSAVHWQSQDYQNWKKFNFFLYSGLLMGGMKRATKEAFEYAKQRTSFGKTIIQHQAVALRLADIAIGYESTRLLVLNSLTETENDFASLKSCIEEKSFKITSEAIQIAGAYGYVEGMPFKRIFERSRAISSMLGIFFK